MLSVFLAVDQDAILHTVKDVFSVIGVVATCGGLGWKVYTWRHGRQTSLTLQIKAGFPTMGPLAFKGCAVITAINTSDHRVRVTSVGNELPDGRNAIVAGQVFPGSLATEIPPRDSASTFMELEPLEREGLDPSSPVVAFVSTSADERFTSPPT